MKEDICKKCNDTGWVVQKKGETEIAQKCDCQEMDQFLSKCRKANIPQRFLTAKLEDYYPDKDSPSQAKAKKIIEKFINDYPSVTEGLLLQGKTGIGKTRLLCTIATELVKKNMNIDIYYIDWNDLIREMRSGEEHGSRDFNAINQLIKRLYSVNLLLFDEIGASRMSPWVLDNIYYLFNKRYNSQKITVCATNYYDKSIKNQETLIKRIGERIRSRLFEMTQIVEIGGKDLRRL